MKGTHQLIGTTVYLTRDITTRHGHTFRKGTPMRVLSHWRKTFTLSDGKARAGLPQGDFIRRVTRSSFSTVMRDPLSPEDRDIVNGARYYADRDCEQMLQTDRMDLLDIIDKYLSPEFGEP